MMRPVKGPISVPSLNHVVEKAPVSAVGMVDRPSCTWGGLAGSDPPEME